MQPKLVHVSEDEPELDVSLDSHQQDTEGHVECEVREIDTLMNREGVSKVFPLISLI